MPELAKAYVQIIPSAEGIKGKLKSVMDGEADNAGKSAGETFGSRFGKVLKTAGAGIAAAASAAVAVAKSAVEGFADFEQLTGGIETLYGNDQQRILDAAAGAFKTAGLSANDYMETAIQSSAAMIKSLDGDTARAAELMDMSITDMADNVNKMGTSMEAIQDAYRGFSRNNFTMLDNLALGYAGTNQGMYELMLRAAELDETFANSADFYLTEKGTLVAGYADMVSAIHIVQTEMGITGTTALEASETVSGSLGAMKAAWQNLLVGMADSEANLGGLIGDVVDSAETAFRNLLPVAEQALAGVGAFVEQIAPVITEKLPGLVETVLPSILVAGSSLLNAVIAALPSMLGVLMEQGPIILNELLDTILAMLPEVVSLALTLVLTLAHGISDSLPELIPTAVDVVLQIVDTLTKPETLGNLIDAALLIIMALADGLIKALPELTSAIPEIIDNLITTISQNGPEIVYAGYELILKLAEGLIKAIPELVWAVPELIMSLLNGFIEYRYKLFELGQEMIDKIKEGFWDKVAGAKQWGNDLMQNFVDGIKEKWNSLKTTVSNVASGIKSFLGFSEPEEGPLSDFHTYAPDMMALFAQGIRDNEHLITDQLGKSFDLSDRLKSGFSSDAEFLRIAEYNPERAKTTGGGFGTAGTPAVDELAEAILRAMEGAGIYLDGDAVGRIITRAQTRAARVNG